MQQAMTGLADVARDHPELDVLLPLHRNSVVRDAVQSVLAGLPNVILTEPLAYAEFAHLMARCLLVVTDSGGVQEEAPSFGKPVLVLRDITERPEGVEAGVVRLIGTDRRRVAHEIERLLGDPTAYAEMARAVNPYGDGAAAQRSVGAIRSLLGLGPMPEAFVVADLESPAAEPVTAQGRP